MSANEFIEWPPLVNWSTCKVGDEIAKMNGWLVTRIKVVNRTPKYVHLSDGAKVHVECHSTDYRQWSDEYEAAVIARRNMRLAQERLARLRMTMSLQGSSHDNYLKHDDVLRDPNSISELERLRKQFDLDREAIIDRIIAERPKAT